MHYTAVMQSRNLRIVKKGLGVCERCNLRFEGDTKPEIKSQFDNHKCKPVDSSQNALRIVREATENE
jgi:hypothetical protein